MKESCSEVLARHAGPESYAGGGNIAGVATAGVHVGLHHGKSRFDKEPQDGPAARSS